MAVRRLWDHATDIRFKNKLCKDEKLATLYLRVYESNRITIDSLVDKEPTLNNLIKSIDNGLKQRLLFAWKQKELVTKYQKNIKNM